MAKYELDPLETVGWEGLFGFLVTLLGMLILYGVVGRTEAGRGGYFDAKEGLSQVLNNRAIAVSSLCIMISIGYVSMLMLLQFHAPFPHSFPYSPQILLPLYILTTHQRLQFLRSLSNPYCFRDLAQHNRYVSDALYLGCESGAWLGNFQVVAGSRFRAFGLWDLGL